MKLELPEFLKPRLEKADPDILKFGKTVYWVDGDGRLTEEWVEKIRRESGVRVDWETVGGRGIVKFLGGKENLTKVREAVRTLEPDARLDILSVPQPGEVQFK